MKFASEYFKNAEELVDAKLRAHENSKDRRKRLQHIRRFSNMMPTLTEEEMEKLNRTENTNFGLAYNSLTKIESQFASMATDTNALVKVEVDTDNAESDLRVGMRITEAINRGAIHFKGGLANQWLRIAGEITIAGGCPVTQNERVGWLPQLRLDMMFPKGTPIEAEKVTYAFDPCELSIADLEGMLRVIGDKEEGARFEKKNIQTLIKALKDQIEKNQKVNSSHDTSASGDSVRSTVQDQNITVSAWKYYEVKYREKNGESYVSYTLFTDGVLGIDVESSFANQKNSAAQIIEYVEEAFPSATDWLQMVYIDSEIGGVKTVDTCIGIAERIYPSSVELEDLMNLVLEGDKDRSRPKYQDNGANADDLAKWNRLEDSMVPKDIIPWDDKSSTGGLQTPMAILQGNISGMTSSSLSNSGRNGELRQQALERQQNSAMLTNHRITQGYNQLDALLETIVWRLLAGKTKPGTDGYQEIMWVRTYLDKYEIPYKDLAKRKYGRFEFLKVKAERAIGGGDSESQVEIATWLVNNQMNYPPANRPLLLNRATAIMTKDPDLADRLAQVPQAVINSQKVIAENECDTIRRRATIGLEIPVAVDDIHQDHIPIHLLDMQCLIGEAQFDPWTKMDVIQFGGLAVHTQEHLRVLLSNPVTNPEAKPFLQDFQNLVQAAQPLIDQVEQAEGNDEQQLTAKERTDMEFKLLQEQRKMMEFGFKVEDMNRIDRQRLSRQSIAARSQFANEVTAAERLKLDRERLKLESERNNSSNNG